MMTADKPGISIVILASLLYIVFIGLSMISNIKSYFLLFQLVYISRPVTKSIDRFFYQYIEINNNYKLP